MQQSSGVERVRYIGSSEVPSFYLLCPEDNIWGAAVLDENDHVVHQLGLFGTRAEAIWAAEAKIDQRTEPPPDFDLPHVAAQPS